MQAFYNSQFKDEVKEYLIDFIKEYAVVQVLARKDISGIADAKDIIEKAWLQLDKNFKPVQKMTVESPE